MLFLKCRWIKHTGPHASEGACLNFASGSTLKLWYDSEVYDYSTSCPAIVYLKYSHIRLFSRTSCDQKFINTIRKWLMITIEEREGTGNARCVRSPAFTSLTHFAWGDYNVRVTLHVIDTILDVPTFRQTQGDCMETKSTFLWTR